MKKTPYTYGSGAWLVALGVLTGTGLSGAWFFPALITGEVSFLWGVPLSMLSGLILGVNSKRKRKRVGAQGILIMRQADAALGRIESMLNNPKFKDEALSHLASSEARAVREEILKKCEELEELRQSSILTKSEFQIRCIETLEEVERIHDLESSLRDYLREIEKVNREAKERASSMIVHEVLNLKSSSQEVKELNK